MDKWIKEMWYIQIQIQIDRKVDRQILENYSAIKKNEILPFATTGMDPKAIMLSEVSQTEKENMYSTYMWNLKKQTNKQKTSSQIQRTDWWLPEMGWRVGETGEGGQKV